MYENNENTENQPEQAKPTYEELEAQVKELEGKLRLAEMSRDSYLDMYRKASDFVQKSIDSDDWQDSELQEPFWTELADLLDLTLNLETEVTVTAVWTMTVKAPRGHEIDQYDFNVSIDAEGPVEIESEDWSPDVDVNY